MIDKWQGDEDMGCGFCGYCGYCKMCDIRYDQRIDDEYEQWKDNMERSV